MLSADQVKQQAKQILFDAYLNPGAVMKHRRGGSDPTKSMPLFSSIKIIERIYNPEGI
jgi:hypothetical protein